MQTSLTIDELLKILVSFNTISALSNIEMIDFIKDYVNGYGIDTDIEFNPDGSKADLIATFGPKIEGGIIISGHTDVVPVQGQNWDSDPFTLVNKNNRLYGRGACDMKGFLAVALSHVSSLSKKKLKVPVHFVFSYDEEIGCLGAPGLVKRLCASVPKPSMAIIGEPTNMTLVNAHKGISLFETSIRGRPAHSSQTHMGVNAINYASKCIQFLSEIAKALKVNENVDERFEPPYSTISLGLINGGSAINIIPEECKFSWECRDISGLDSGWVLSNFEEFCSQKLLPEMRIVAPEADIKTINKVMAPPLVTTENNPAESFIKKLSGQNKVDVVAYAAEAGIFQNAEIPAIIFGPGSINQAHRPNEYITVSQLKKCDEFFDKLIDWASH
ncbi:acetylornithine deacetylase [Rhodospirillales bacterium]|nr:acetylornithine deacetylase [Rhodospirillales bacterium]